MALEIDSHNSTQYVTVANHSSLQVTHFTLCGWAYRLNTTGQWERLMAKSANSGGAGVWLDYYIQCRNDNQRLQVGYYGTALRNLDGTTTCPTTTWFHFAGSYDGSYLRVYFNGAKEATGPLLTDPVQTRATALDFGRLYYSTTAYYGLDAVLTDCRVYNRALSDGEIATIYHSRGADAITNGLCGRWLMNEQPHGSTASGAGVVIDVSPYGNHGTPANSPPYWAAPLKLV